jgi:hypothetical protein
MQSIMLNVQDSQLATFLNYLKTLNYVEVVSPSKEGAAKSYDLLENDFGTMDNTPFDLAKIDAHSTLTWENIVAARTVFKDAPFDELEKLLTK